MAAEQGTVTSGTSITRRTVWEWLWLTRGRQPPWSGLKGGTRPYRGGWLHLVPLLLPPPAVGLLIWLSQCGGQFVRDVVFGALATLLAAFASFVWYQRRSTAARRAKRKLIDASTTCAEERMLQNLLQDPQADPTETVKHLKRISPRLRRQLADEKILDEIKAMVSTSPGPLLDGMRLDLWRDRFFGDVSFGCDGDEELGLPVCDVLVEWSRLIELARQAQALRRRTLLRACLRSAEAAIAPLLYVDTTMLPGLCLLLSAEIDPEHQLRLGAIHYSQVRYHERFCLREDPDMCLGCPRKTAASAQQPRKDAVPPVEDTFFPACYPSPLHNHLPHAHGGLTPDP